MNQAPIMKLAHITHGLRTGRGRRSVELQAATILEQQATQLDQALTHLVKVLRLAGDPNRTREERVAVESAARQFLLDCGR